MSAAKTATSCQPPHPERVDVRPGRSQRPSGSTAVKLVGGRQLFVAPGPLELQIATVAEVQSARISRRQLLALGVTPAMIKTRIAHGSLVSEHRAVYAVTRMPVERGRETAALLAVGPPVALGDEFAGALWGFWEDPPVDLPITVIVPGCRARSRPGIRVRRSRSLTAADVTVHEGLPVTTPARIIFDLAAAGHPPRRVERAFDEAWARHLISRTKMTEQLERHRGRPGTPLLAQLLAPDRGRGVTREAAEERLLQLIRQAHLPDPDRNVQLGPYTVDFLWPEAGVAVEFDSFTWHSSASAFRRDREKDAYMKDVGLDLQRVTWSMLEDPVALIARLVRAVALGTRRAAAA